MPNIGILIEIIPESNGSVTTEYQTEATEAMENTNDTYRTTTDPDLTLATTQNSRTSPDDVWLVTWGTSLPQNDTTPEYYFLLNEDFAYNQCKVSNKKFDIDILSIVLNMIFYISDSQ